MLYCYVKPNANNHYSIIRAKMMITYFYYRLANPPLDFGYKCCAVVFFYLSVLLLLR